MTRAGLRATAARHSRASVSFPKQFRRDRASVTVFSVAERPGPAIREARTRASTTLRALADAIGVSVGTMSAIETAKVAMLISPERPNVRSGLLRVAANPTFADP